MDISVIIPTHNRSTPLRRTLDALGAQNYPLRHIEIIVVADGCTDGTADMLRHYTAPCVLRVVEQSCQGAGGARNHGAAAATGRLLLFLDDDMEPASSLLQAHVDAHRRWPGCVIIGASPPVLPEERSLFLLDLRRWWEDQFHRMRRPDHRYTYRDLLTGNLSIEAGLFARVGGFDVALPCREDYEFGMRLIKAGTRLVFAADAVSYHHETADLNRSFRRVRQEGCADVRISRRYPELRHAMPLASLELPGSRLSRTLRACAFERPRVGDGLAATLRSTLNLLERMRLRGRWRRLCNTLRDYWYWRGVADELGSRRALAGFLQGGPIHVDESAHEIEIDLREGLEAAERRVDEERPACVRIRYGKQPVGRIPPAPGAERLRGVHLRSGLARQLAAPLLIALAMDAAQGERPWP